jgi:glycosyltransferase involved in cell wall biosynthesis
MSVELTVIVPTHNPEFERLRRTLTALRAQTLPSSRWETVLVNNASTRFPPPDFFSACAPANFSIVEESALGLTAARRRGFSVAEGNTAVLVDDDNVLASDYLEQVTRIFSAQPKVGVAGGSSMPEFATEPPVWTREFFPLLALRDLGAQELISNGLRPAGGARNQYPEFAPIGAGMALRRAAWIPWIDFHRTQSDTLSDRRGDELTSGGDNDLVLCALRAGWEAGYFPALKLIHLIPAARLHPNYLARLNRGIQKSWMQVLALHEANPWPPLSPAGAKLRQLKAWLIHRPWTSPAARIRWQGACGHFEGRIAE